MGEGSGCGEIRRSEGRGSCSKDVVYEKIIKLNYRILVVNRKENDYALCRCKLIFSLNSRHFK